MYYIDFDNTLYETSQMSKDTLKALAAAIVKCRREMDKDDPHAKHLTEKFVLDDLTSIFNSSVENFYGFAKRLAVRYHVRTDPLKAAIYKTIVLNGKKYVYPDAIRFLQKLKEEGEFACLLTYVAIPQNLHQQANKLDGSGIMQYVTEVYCTTRDKGQLEIDYANPNNVFIDDNPRELESYYKAGARNLIRISKPNNERRTSKPLDLPIKVPNYDSFDKIKIQRHR